MIKETEQAPKDTRRGIQSVEVGFQLINQLAAARGKLPLKTLAEKAGMTPSKAHLYLVSFLRIGIVSQDQTTSRYGLGPAALQLGMSAINQMDVVDLAREYLPDILEKTETSVSLAVWGNLGPTIVFRLDSEIPVPLSVRVGYVLPMLTTATGRTFMAHLAEREWLALAKVENRTSPGLLAKTNKNLQHIRDVGVATTENLSHMGFFGVSCPIFDNEDKICAAITSIGLSHETDIGEDSAVASALREASQSMSKDLGAFSSRSNK
ncbi:MAG: IclR family transcriptional regulator [Hyphomicrobiales bacterium]|nr:MAG: IclR family transcriptional regulator [Hyphomicrobiales bacterium]